MKVKYHELDWPWGNTCDYYISFCVADQQSGRVYKHMRVFYEHRVQKLADKKH